MGKTALIVDDSRTARVVLQNMLETHDLQVDTAGSAESALGYLSENRPDIIFMDHEMPGMDGFEAVSAIKKNPATATIPIMMYTAQEGELYVGQARALGAVGVLPKEVEPVELSKVLESLRVIGEDAERREHYKAIEEESTSGEYPSLAKFDQDLGALIQELFDQQRAILRRDLRDSQAKIVARVADEIKLPEADDSDIKARWFERHRPAFSQLALALVAVFAVVFAWLYWQTEQSRRELQQQNDTLQRALDQLVFETEDLLQFQQQSDNYQQSLDSTRKAALSSIEWAANQKSQYSFDELPLGDFRLSVIAEMANQLAALDFSGLIRIEAHVGNFCMSASAAEGYTLAAVDLPALQCDQIGFAPNEAYELGSRQSVAFANFIDLADERNGGKIRYEIVSQGNSSPLLTYPATADGVPASAWNEIAASNNRVEISLYPDEN
ncbi:MAG: response regulator [Gammaproteobacteria bacterium]|nr:response regulator [Gammaproteobacteria bacterium]